MEKLLLLVFIFAALALPQTATAQRETVDLIVLGGTIVTMDAEKRVIKNGSIAVKGDSIVAVGKSGPISKKYKSRRKVYARNKV
ncbi:MAG: hypothetical protein HKN25_02890, partial [Pyrinomonadaceae bacterium]|nr:hypothetical protein [Pyrinomonadaceae bacterium]